MASFVWSARRLLQSVMAVSVLTNDVLCQGLSGDGNVNIWIQSCTINVNWTAAKDTEGCYLQIYRVQLYRNNTELSLVDTTALRYSLDGIDSESIYRAIVVPIFRCSDNRDKQGESMEKSVSAIPDGQARYITKFVSYNFSLSSCISGAYEPFSTNWTQRKGIKNTNVRNFTTTEINIERLTYNDAGKYVCTAEFYMCGGSRLRRRMTNSVTLSINGPPEMNSPIKTTRVNIGDNLTLSMSLVSFPPPNQITVINQNNKTLHQSMTFEPAILSTLVFGTSVDVYGYNTQLNLLNITKDWIGTNIVIISNRMGSNSYVFAVEEYFDKENPIVRFLEENSQLLAGAGAGFLVLVIIIIVAVIITDMKKKRRQRSLSLGNNQNQQSGVDPAAANIHEHLYARPFSFGNVQQHEGQVTLLTEHQKRIELERQQCASMYSCAGFSLNEFQDDAIMYDNQFAPEYK